MTATPDLPFAAPGPHLLERIALFAPLDADARAAAAARCRFAGYGEGAIVASPDTAEGHVHFVLSGLVRVSGPADHAGEVEFSDISEGGYFGELAVLADAAPVVHAVAVTPCEIAMMPAEAFLHLVEAEPAIAVTLLKHHARGAMEARLQPQADAAALEARLARELLRLAEPDRNAAAGQALIPRLPRHREFAAWTGMDEAQVANALAGLVKTKCVARRYPGLAILDETRLRELAADQTPFNAS